MRAPRSILITGASSGIGAALAAEYAAPGVHLVLCGRDAARIHAVAEACRARGATADARVVDVTDASGVAAWIEAADAARPLDLVIANAGVAGGRFGTGEGDEAARRVLSVNVDGVVNTVLPALARMRARRNGQIAIMSSLAAFRGFPGAPAYSASKAAVRAWGEALRGRHAREGVAISVICPGFVISRMTADNPFPMPMLMSAERAARIIRRGLARDRGRIAFPWPMYALVRLVATLPDRLIDPLMRRLPEKE
jgi:short-subunit dehydrogenase